MALGDSAKADQIAFPIYTKLFHVLYAARASEQGLGPGQGKTDKLRISGSTSKLRSPHLPLCQPSSSTPFAPYLLPTPSAEGAGGADTSCGTTAWGWDSAGAQGGRNEGRARAVVFVVGGWVIALAASSASSSESDTATSRSSSTDDESSADVLPPTIYKNVIALFRALYALLRILPAWRVVRKLTSGRAPSGAGGGPLDKRGLQGCEWVVEEER
ncbi:hypothetical protein B0H13DRAFT_2338005 [Mycena leptocephala]|nr:hypothetical protein B0H13DRAFT_2338005 [Mycena leptocephala]